MTTTTPGLHHVTAICGEPTPNAEFYVGTLGLRLVKWTVNHDDPATLHLYYGDYRGSPGTNLTFFPWTGRGRSGRFGAGQTRATAYAIRPESLDFWRQRLEDHGVEETSRFDDTVLTVDDPDGIRIELITDPSADDAGYSPWDDGPVAVEHQLCGFHSVTLAVANSTATKRILTDTLDYDAIGESDDRTRLQASGDESGSIIDLVEVDGGRGQMGIGTVHHVAFRVEDRDHQEQVRRGLRDAGLQPTDSVDRVYFRSVYCREPGGILFEFATMGPGFTRDEDVDELGKNIALPPWLEEEREAIENNTPAFSPPTG